MNIYTNTGLVQHCEKALSLPTKYMWGGILRTIEKQYDLLFSIYGIDTAKGYTQKRWNELTKLKNKGIYGVDCVGLIKSYYWSGKHDGGVGSPLYCSADYPDIPAGDMYNRSKHKGKIGTMPEIPGLVVYSKTHPHVGVYIGNGYTIESTLGSRGDGVTKRKIDSFWEFWFECPFIEYPEYPALSAPLHAPAKTTDIDAIAREVISGKWGTGADRKKRLTDAGYDYYEVQRRLNEMLRGL